MKKVILGLIALMAAGVAGLLLIQLIPYGNNHTNPPVVQEPNWDSPRTRELAKRACFDCHSNESTWPWYSNIAPVSWLVQHDVEEGRSALNFSDWRVSRRTEELAEIVLEGEMPPATYLIMHPQAKLSTNEKQELASGLMATASR
jgi:mono/diheme cytochrome c family protein